MDFGYYRVLSVSEGDYVAHVRDYTNLAYVGPVDGGTSEVNEADRATLLKQVVKRLSKNFQLMLDVEMNVKRLPFGKTLKAARPVWDKVKYLILDDELDPNTWNIKKDLMRLRKKLGELGLEDRRTGATFTPLQLMDADISKLSPLDFVNIESYHDLGVANPKKQIVDRTNKIIDKLAGKPFSIVMQAYDRNGAFPHVNQMVEIQEETFKVASQRGAIALIMFAYGRKGGTRDYLSLQQIHRFLAGKL